MRARVLADRMSRDSNHGPVTLPLFAIERICTGIILYGHSENANMTQNSFMRQLGSRYPHGGRAAFETMTLLPRMLNQVIWPECHTWCSRALGQDMTQVRQIGPWLDSEHPKLPVGLYCKALPQLRDN